MLRLLQRATPLFAAAALLIVGACAWPYTVDDAYIVARYAARLAHGLGYTLSGKLVSDGVTAPLSLVPGVVAARFAVEPVVAQKVLGLAAMALAVALTLQRLGKRASGRRLQWVALLLVACTPTFGTWGVAGLETGLATLALCVALLGVTARPKPQSWLVGVAMAALAWLRPELGVASSVLLATLTLRLRRGAWPAWLLACASAVGVCLFRWRMFGDALPLAFHAKHGTWLDGAGYTARAAFVLAGGLGLVPLTIAITQGRRDDRSAGLMIIAHGVAVVLAGGDWMPGFRLFVPVLPAYVALVAVGVQRMARTRVGVALAGLSLICACGVPLLDLITRVPELRGAGHARDTKGAQLAAYLHHYANRVALVDIGYLGDASGIEVVDLAGVTDAEIARLPGGYLDKRIPDTLLSRRAPDAIVLHASEPAVVDAQGHLLSLRGYPVERRVAASPWVRARFRVTEVIEYAPRYQYVVLLRDDRRAFLAAP